MSNPSIISEEPITMVELRDELKKIKKRDEELNFRANKAEEYLDQSVGLSNKENKELKDKIEGLKIPRLKNEHLIKILDILPTTQEEVKLLFSGYVITVSADNMKKISNAVKAYLDSKK